MFPAPVRQIIGFKKKILRGFAAISLKSAFRYKKFGRLFLTYNSLPLSDTSAEFVNKLAGGKNARARAVHAPKWKLIFFRQWKSRGGLFWAAPPVNESVGETIFKRCQTIL